MFRYDNTLTTKTEANRAVLDPTVGNETCLYKIGMKVNGEGLGFKQGVITDVYRQNGYYYYVIEYTSKSQIFIKTLRQKDISIK